MASKVVKTYFTPEEHLQVSEKAKQAGMALSAFIRRACMGQEVYSTIDKKAYLELLKTKGDLGRLGGLLKQYLGGSESNLASREEVRELLKNIEVTHRIMAADFNRVSKALLEGHGHPQDKTIR